MEAKDLAAKNEDGLSDPYLSVHYGATPVIRGLGTRWSHWLGIGAICLVDESTGGKSATQR